MNRPRLFGAFGAVPLVLLLAVLPVVTAVDAALSVAPRAAERTSIAIGYLEIDGDARYGAPRAYAGIEVRPRPRPFSGAEVALHDSRVLDRALKLDFALERASAASAAELAERLDALVASGVRFFLVDADTAALSALAERVRDRDVLLFNVSEPDDTLRGTACAANLLHTMPSRSMLSDALVQYLVARRWAHILVLRGPEPDDALASAALEASARKFGAKIVATRDFVLSNDPRERDLNNVILMTQGEDYDVVFIADTLGATAREVPYRTALPRPVVGAEGLIAEAWHWTWERYGAPQLNQRFERLAERRMTGRDWAAWAAVKAIVEAVARTQGGDFAAVRDFLLSDDLRLDGYKGSPMSFRAWDRQLRQPILLHTETAVVAQAPIEGFLHPTQYMDTLGADAPETKCVLR